MVELSSFNHHLLEDGKNKKIEIDSRIFLPCCVEWKVPAVVAVGRMAGSSPSILLLFLILQLVPKADFANGQGLSSKVSHRLHQECQKVGSCNAWIFFHSKLSGPQEDIESELDLLQVSVWFFFLLVRR